MCTFRKTMSKFIFIFITLINGQSRAMDEWEAWPLTKLENEVSPSRWNPTKSPDQVIQEYVDSSIQGTHLAQNAIPHELNIPYGSKPAQQFDEYGSDLPPDAPIYVWIHGGYYQEGSKDISGLFAPKLHAEGVRNIVVGYTLAPVATIAEIEQEVFQALKTVVEKYPHAKITLGGHSAGAQLAAMFLHSDTVDPVVVNQIQGFHLVSGIYDLRPLISTYVNNPLKLTRSTAEASSPLRIRKISQHFLNKGSQLKISVTIGKYDSSLFQQQAQEYYKLLRKSFTSSEFWKSDSDDHFSLVENMAKKDSEAGTQFLGLIKEISNSYTANSAFGGKMSTNLILTILSIITLFLRLV